MPELDRVKNPVLLSRHFMTSPFGIRTINGQTRMHNGIDLVGYEDGKTTISDIISIESGKVFSEGFDAEMGNFIVINSGDFMAHYYHLAFRSSWKVGQTVRKGDIIGRMGNTGKSTGAHLHLGIKVNGTLTDPLPFLEGDEMDYDTWKEYMARYLSDQEHQPASEWSEEALSWAKEKGILFGDDKGNLQPRSFCTREMLVTILRRIIK